MFYIIAAIFASIGYTVIAVIKYSIIAVWYIGVWIVQGIIILIEETESRRSKENG